MDNPNMIPTPTPTPAPSESKAGPIIGIAIVIIVLVIGALYFWGERLSKENMSGQAVGTETEQTPDFVVANLKTQSSSDDLSSIQADLSATASDALDQDFQNAIK